MSSLAALMALPDNECKCGLHLAECPDCGLGYVQRLHVLKAVFQADDADKAANRTAKVPVKRKALEDPQLLSDDEPSTDDESIFAEDCPLCPRGPAHFLSIILNPTP
jgi:hypothetical protein